MKNIIHSPACNKLMGEWYRAPHDSVEYRLAGYVYNHTDIEIRDALLTIFDEDPPTSPAAAAARTLWPLLVCDEPPHQPDDLLAELDSVIRDYDALSRRIAAVAAKYRALEPWSERWNRHPHENPEFGELNIAWAVRDLDSGARAVAESFARERLQTAREYAAKIRDYSAEADR